MTKDNKNNNNNDIIGNVEEVANSLRDKEKESEELLKDPEKTKEKLDEAEEKIKKIKNGTLKDVIEDLILMIQLVKAYIKKEYTKVPFRTIVSALAAILYVLNPFDLIPDAIPGIGYIDDAFVVLLVVKAIHSDLRDFKEWQEE